MTYLKKIRKEKGLTLSEVSNYLGYMYPGSYTKIENGKQKLRGDQVIKLAKLFGVSEKKILQKSYSE